jgi:hypothetical protein
LDATFFQYTLAKSSLNITKKSAFSQIDKMHS